WSSPAWHCLSGLSPRKGAPSRAEGCTNALQYERSPRAGQIALSLWRDPGIRTVIVGRDPKPSTPTSMRRCRMDDSQATTETSRRKFLRGAAVAAVTGAALAAPSVVKAQGTLTVR